MFKNIRETYGWSNTVIVNSFCDNENFKNPENANKGGRSSAFIFKTHNDELIIKTITKEEKYKYHGWLMNHGNSRIFKILGLYKIRSSKQSFVIMENLLKNKENATVFDLKGSLHDRYTSFVGKLGGVTLKDQNLIDMYIRIFLTDSQRNEIVHAIHEDSVFLRELDIIDYSLILGFYPPTVRNENRYPLKGYNHDSYSIGLIDFLQQYTLSKKLELTYKKLKCKKNLSVCPAFQYSERFMAFISRLFEFE